MTIKPRHAHGVTAMLLLAPMCVVVTLADVSVAVTTVVAVAAMTTALGVVGQPRRHRVVDDVTRRRLVAGLRESAAAGARGRCAGVDLGGHLPVRRRRGLGGHLAVMGGRASGAVVGRHGGVGRCRRETTRRDDAVEAVPDAVLPLLANFHLHLAQHHRRTLPYIRALLTYRVVKNSKRFMSIVIADDSYHWRVLLRTISHNTCVQ